MIEPVDGVGKRPWTCHPMETVESSCSVIFRPPGRRLVGHLLAERRIRPFSVRLNTTGANDENIKVHA